jgi:GT2 family glycosyltransferase/glycosyltransferase involved in cell wall biosynthesis
MQAPNPSPAPPPALVLCLPVDGCSTELQVLNRTAGAVLFPRPVAPDWRAELVALRKHFPAATIVRVRRADLWLAADALPRLIHAASLARGPLTALCNVDSQLTVASPDTTLRCEPAVIDAAVHALGEHRLHPVAASAPAILVLAAGADASADLELVDHVYVHAPDAIVGLETPADRRERAPAHPLAALRHALRQASGATATDWTMAARDARPVVLHILHGWGGGAERFVRDLARSDDQRHHLLLRASGSPSRRRHGEFLELLDARGGSPLRRALMSPPIGALAQRHEGYAQALAGVIADFAVEQVWVSSLIGHALDVLATGLPLRWVAHDYFPFWPALHRDFGATGARFDAAELAADLHHDGPFAERDPAFWQAICRQVVTALLAARAEIIAPSHGVLANLGRVAPALAALPQRCIAHGSAGWPGDEAALRAARYDAGGKLRVVVLGRINGAKGLDLLRQLLPGLAQHCDLYLVGAGKAAEALFGTSGVHVLLDYAHAQLPTILARIRPHLALLPATVAETFSYTLSELWRLAIPPVATRLGAFAERIEDGVDGLLVEPDPASVAGCIARLALDRAPLLGIHQTLQMRSPRSLAEMLADYQPLLPLGSRVPLRYPLRRCDSASLAIAVHADALGDHQLRLADAEMRLAEQQVELARRAEWGFDLNRQLDERTRWAQDLEQELGRTRLWLNERESVFEQSRATAETLCAHLEVSLTQLQGELSRIMEEAERQREALEGRIGDLMRTLDERAEQIEALRSDVVRQEQARAELEAERQQFALAREQLQREFDSLAAHRAEMIASTSWRITKPLRAIGRLLKRIRASLRFRASRLASLAGRVRGSLARRGLRGTFARARQEMRDHAQQAPVTVQVETPQPAETYAPLRIATSGLPRVSVIVPVYNQLHHTWNCLKALADTAGSVPFEVIVVDDGSSDATAIEVPKVGGVRFHKNPQNLGFIGACNAGAALAHGQYLFFLNNDTAVQPGWLEPLVASYGEFERVGLVGSRLIYPDGRLQEAGGIVFNDGSGWNYGRFDHPDDPRYDYPREADYCSGAAILIEKALFDSFGGFDSLYKPAYYEDTDLAFKVRAAGLRVIYQPASRVVHFEGVTGGTDTSSGTKRYQVINRQKFLERWKDALAQQPVPTDHAGIWRAATHRAQGRILLIDATTPTPDQDSGSVRYINLVRVLNALGWQCTFFADNRAYVPRYTDELRALGVEVLHGPWLNDPVAFFRERGRQFDAVMLSRHYVARHYVDLAREHAPQARVLFDTVDLHYLREQRAAKVEQSEALAKQAEATREAELDLIRRCDVTLVVSPVELELLSREAPGQRVEVLSNIHEVHGRRAGFDARKDIWFVGGFQHQPNVDAVVWFVAEIWPRVRTALPETQFHIVGSKCPPEVAALAGNGVIVHGFVEHIEPFLDGIRVAVAPLRYGAGVKGKVNQSMAYGQPVVATPIAVEGMQIATGSEALVTAEPATFASEVVRLYQDPELWLRLSDAGLANIESHFSFEAASKALQHILRG